MPTLYVGHGAPPLMDDPLWPIELAEWASNLPRPKSILIVSAHWEEAPLTIGATTPVPLVYDFYGFPRRYYEVTYPSPGAPELAQQVRKLVADLTPTADEPYRGRVLSTLFLNRGMVPLGTVIAGVGTSIFGVQATLATMGGALLVLALLVKFSSPLASNLD